MKDTSLANFLIGVPVYLRAIFRDVTKRKESSQRLAYYTQELEEREENLNQLITNAPDAIIVIDEDNRILLWNPKAENIFGWKTSEVLGNDLSDTIIPEAYREGHRQGVKRVVQTGKTKLINTTVQVTAITKQNNIIHISLTLSQSVQRGKNIFISFVRDITEQKNNEIELESKRKELIQSNLQLEQYAWLVSHDLKEPLRKIITYSDLLKSRHANELTETPRNYLEKIYSSTRRMNILIEAILEYSQLSNDPGQFIKTDLNSIILEVLADIEILYRKIKR